MPEVTAKLLREVARKIEEDASRALAEFADPAQPAGPASEVATPRTQGNLQDFPRSFPRYPSDAAGSGKKPEVEQAAPEAMPEVIPAAATELGRTILDDANDRAVAMLYALAATLETNPHREIPPALLIPIQPYIDAYGPKGEKKTKRSP